MKQTTNHQLEVGGCCRVAIIMRKFDDGVWHGRAKIHFPAQTYERTYRWETFASTEDGVLDAVNKRAEQIADSGV